MLAASETLIGLLFDAEFALYDTATGSVIAPRMTVSGLRLLGISVSDTMFMVLAAGTSSDSFLSHSCESVIAISHTL